MQIGDIILFKGNIIETHYYLSDKFILLFKLHVRGTNNGFDNIIRFTGTDNKEGCYGDGWLVFWFNNLNYLVIKVGTETDIWAN